MPTPVYQEQAEGKLNKTLVVIIVVVPFIALGVAIRQLWQGLVTATDLVLFFGTVFFIGLGVTMGLHRYFTHGSFRANMGVRIALATLASLSLQGKIEDWVANHRLHHAFSDTPYDIHSPWILRLHRMEEPENPWDLVAGFFFAHVGWLVGMFGVRGADPKTYARTLLEDPLIMWFSRTNGVWAVMTFLFPLVIGGLIAAVTQKPIIDGALHGLLWGGVVRILFVHHITWSINSICHMFGEHAYATNDSSRDVKWLALFTLGEAWHCRHHARQISARHGTAWWNDPTYACILILERMGWVSHIKVIPEEEYEKIRIVQ